MRPDDIARPELARLKTSALERNLALTKLGFGAGASMALHAMTNIFKGANERTDADRAFYLRQAHVLASELGSLKGSVMKAGQMLSLYGQYFLPPEAVDVLSGLQDNTPPVAWAVVEPVLRRELGPRLAELDIDRVPLAAASLGQAHRAIRKSDGKPVVVKIQYPGVAEAIDSDIRTLSRLLTMTRLAPKDLDLAPMYAEVREMLMREVDYVAEAQATREFRAKLAGDPRFIVPEVIDEFSTARVLTTSFEAGVSPRALEVLALSQARRDRLGLAFVELFLTEFFDWRLVQTDPHFGNYRVRLADSGGDGDGDGTAADRIVLLDFGAVRRFPARFVADYAQIVRGGLEGNPVLVRQGATGIRLMDEGMPPAVLAEFGQLCERIVEPFDPPRAPAALQGPNGYRFGASELPMRVATQAARGALSKSFRIPPREIVFLHRRLAGVFIMLATLNVELDLRSRLDAALVLAESRRT